MRSHVILTQTNTELVWLHTFEKFILTAFFYFPKDIQNTFKFCKHHLRCCLYVLQECSRHHYEYLIRSLMCKISKIPTLKGKLVTNNTLHISKTRQLFSLHLLNLHFSKSETYIKNTCRTRPIYNFLPFRIHFRTVYMLQKP